MIDPHLLYEAPQRGRGRLEELGNDYHVFNPSFSTSSWLQARRGRLFGVPDRCSVRIALFRRSDQGHTGEEPTVDP